MGLVVVALGILLVNSLFGLIYTAAEAMMLVPNDTGAGLDPLAMVSPVASGSAIGPNLLVVVNWKMGTEAPLSGVIPTGGSDGLGLLWGVSVQLLLLQF